VLNNLNHLNNLRVEEMRFWFLKQGISGIAHNTNFILYASCPSCLFKHVCTIAKSDCSFAMSVWLSTWNNVAATRQIFVELEILEFF